MHLVPHTGMTEEENTLQKLIRSVISFFWKALLFAIRYVKLNIAIPQRKRLWNPCLHAFLRVRKHKLNNKLQACVADINSGMTVHSFTLAAPFSWYMDGSSAGLPAAHLVAPMSSARALATSRTAFIRTTWGDTVGINMAQWSEYRFISNTPGKGFNTAAVITPT